MSRDFEQISGQIVSKRVKKLSNTKKGSLPVDVRRSKTSLLKLPTISARKIVESQPRLQATSCYPSEHKRLGTERDRNRLGQLATRPVQSTVCERVGEKSYALVLKGESFPRLPKVRQTHGGMKRVGIHPDANASFNPLSPKMD